MNTLTICSSEIRQLDNLYSLNDLHKAAGNLPSKRPNQFMRRDTTKELIAEIQCAESRSAEKTINGGPDRGTYVCKELVYAYAMWISAKFHLTVIRAFDAIQSPQRQVPARAGDVRELARQLCERLLPDVTKLLAESWRADVRHLQVLVDSRYEEPQIRIHPALEPMRQPGLPAPAPPRFHYPKEIWQGLSNRAGATGWITFRELANMPQRPLEQLLGEIQAGGSNIEGAVLEYRAMRLLLESMYWKLEDISRLTDGASQRGLPVHLHRAAG